MQIPRRSIHALVIVAGMWPILPVASAAGADAPAWTAELRRAVAVELAADAPALAGAIPAVDVEATYDPAAGRLAGRLHAAVNNPTDEAWPDLGFALHANNAASYRGCSTNVDRALVDGREVRARSVEDGRGTILPLAAPLAPGAWTDCVLEFTTTIPAGDDQGRAGLLARGEEAHALYSWLPEPAVRDAGWRFPAFTPMADPSFVRCCDYRARLRLPASWTVVAGGRELRDADGDWLLLAPRCRNLTAWLSDRPVERLVLQPAAGPTIRVSYLGKHTVRAAFCASVARDALAVAARAFGPYTRRSYDVVFTRFSVPVGGMEASGLTFISREAFEGLDRRSFDPLVDGSNHVLHSVIHEVLHSWWYDQVGSDPYRSPWLDEPLTEWSTWYVIEQLRGRETMLRVAARRLLALLSLHGRYVPTASPMSAMDDQQFGVLLYCRGPFIYEALRQEVGEEQLLEALGAWYRLHAGRTVARSDWNDTFLALLPEGDREAFARAWLDGTDEPLPPQLERILPAEELSWLRKALAAMEAETAGGAEATGTGADDRSPPAP